MGEEGSAFEVYENGRPRIKSLADYQDDGESDTDPRNSDFQWKERPIAIENSQPSKMMYRSKRVVAKIGYAGAAGPGSLKSDI
jgi:hypothetical protein